MSSVQIDFARSNLVERGQNSIVNYDRFDETLTNKSDQLQDSSFVSDDRRFLISVRSALLEIITSYEWNCSILI